MASSKTIFLRDDDTSFFTSPAQLERIYGTLWQAGIPVNLAVIPAPRSDVRVLHRDGQPYDPGIPPQFRGQSREFALWENAEICQFLNDKVKQGLVEICLHGYNHDYYEFEQESPKLIAQKLDTGKRELQQTFPYARIKTFIAPYDRISPTAFELITERGYNVPTNSTSLLGAGIIDVQNNQKQVMDAGNKLYAGDEYFFSHHAPPIQCEELAMQRLDENDLLIVTNHYWTFFYDWNGEWDEMLAGWDRFVDKLLSLPDARFSTFAKG
ncbi:MAG: DUF2334 domain-containing protein [Aggregatilineales bacterium]